MSMKKYFNKKNILIAILIGSLFASTYWLLRDFNLNDFILEQIIKQINSSINGKTISKKLIWRLDRQNLQINFDELVLIDSINNEILKAKDLEITYPLNNLIRFKKVISKIASKSIVLNASRATNNQWDVEIVFEKLLKKSPKKQKFEVLLLALDNCTININDRINNNQVHYEDFKIFFEQQRNHIYSFDIETNNATSEATKNIALSGFQNYIKINGDINLSSIEDLLDSANDLDITISNLDYLSLHFFSIFLPNNIKTLADKYSTNTSLSFVAQLEPITNEHKYKQSINLSLIINNLANYPKTTLEGKMKVGRDLNIENISLSFLDCLITFKGQVFRWNDDYRSKLQTELIFKKLNLSELRNRFSELQTVIPGYVVEILSLINTEDTVDGSIAFTNTRKNPSLKAKIPLANLYTKATGKSNDLEIELKSNSKNFIVDKFTLPLDFSTINLKGEFDKHNNSFQMSIQGQDIPLLKLKPVVLNLPFLNEYHDFMEASKITGYAGLDLIFNRPNITPIKTSIHGNIKLARSYFLFKNYPLEFNNFAANLELKDRSLIINKLQGQIRSHNEKPYTTKTITIDYGDFIEAEGTINLNDIKESELKLQSPNISTSTIINSQLLRFLPKQLAIETMSGNLNDLKIEINNTMVQKFSTKLNDLNIRTANSFDILHAFGFINLNDNKVTFDRLHFATAPESPVSIDGYINRDLEQGVLTIKADNINLKYLSEALSLSEKHKLTIDKGQGFLDLKFNNKNLNGQITFQDLDCLYSGSKYFKHKFSNLTGEIKLEEDLTATITKGKYGDSVINKLSLEIGSFLDKELASFRSLDLEANILTNEVLDLIPTSIRNFMNMKGYCPTKVLLTGNNLNKNLTVAIRPSNLDYFSFSNWLVLDRSVETNIISSMTITPRLIKSQETILTFSNPQNPTQSVKLKADFEVREWKDKDLNYNANFITNNENELGLNLKLLEPHIITLIPLNLDPGYGKFTCNTQGTIKDRSTYCNFNINNGVAKKYGIGDLTANKIDLNLLSLANEPLYMIISLADGNWNGIPLRKTKFDLRALGEMVYIDDLRTRVLDGMVRANISFNIKTFESTFTLRGLNTPAHELVQGIWGLGQEVPEGLVSGVFSGSTKGLLPDEMFFNLDGTANIIVKNGKLSQLKTMQKILTAVNTLDNFEINNIFQSLITFKGGLFDHIISSLEYNHGRISSKKVLLKASQIEFDMNGYLDFNKDLLWIEGNGMIPKHSQSILQTIGLGKANLGNLLSINRNSKDKRMFTLKILGPLSNMDKSIESVKSSFRWLETPE